MGLFKKHRHPRRVLFVNKSFQIRFIIRFILVELLTIALTVLLASFFTIYMFHTTTISSGAWGETLIYNMVILTVVLALFIAWRTILASNRIAGPVYRIGKGLEQIGEGDASARIILRPRDELQPFAWKFNDMVENLAERSFRQRELLARLEDDLTRLGAHSLLPVVKDIEDLAFRMSPDMEDELRLNIEARRAR